MAFRRGVLLLGKLRQQDRRPQGGVRGICCRLHTALSAAQERQPRRVRQGHQPHGRRYVRLAELLGQEGVQDPQGRPKGYLGLQGRGGDSDGHQAHQFQRDSGREAGQRAVPHLPADEQLVFLQYLRARLHQWRAHD